MSRFCSLIALGAQIILKWIRMNKRIKVMQTWPEPCLRWQAQLTAALPDVRRGDCAHGRPAARKREGFTHASSTAAAPL
jgi:hypothetical protein